jgi:simple sugar transport system ATP-binding protein
MTVPSGDSVVQRPDLAVEMRSLTKAFAGKVVNDQVNLLVRRGSIHALLGENGAGKSTCMNMLFGVIKPDSGEILINGRVCRLKSPRDAIAIGLGMVHQHFMLSPVHDGLDNIILGDEQGYEGRKGVWQRLRPYIPRRLLRREILQVAQRGIDLDRKVRDLTVGVQQKLEIAKLLYRRVDIMILDEPTAVLTPGESAELFASLKAMREAGKTVIVITHKLKEVLSHCDEFTVIRRGRVVGGGNVKGQTEESLAGLMVGKKIDLTLQTAPVKPPGDLLLQLNNVTVTSVGSKPRLDRLSLSVRSGEIVGIAGVEGNGQRELITLLAEPSVLRRESKLQITGDASLLGKNLTEVAAQRPFALGVIPQDRHRHGLLLARSQLENFLLGLHFSPKFSNWGVLRRDHALKSLKKAQDEFDIRPRDPSALLGSMSGGNQQKLIVAREFARDPQVLIAAEPTRGVDIAASFTIHERLLKARNDGMGVLLISTSLDEVMALSDRLLVMYEGRIVGEFARGTADELKIGHLMGGGTLK